jgi:site-specific recombinase, putative
MGWHRAYPLRPAPFSRSRGKPVATEAPYGYIKDPENKDYWIVDKEAAEVVKLIFRLFMEGKNRNQIAVYLKEKEILTQPFI